MAKSKRGRELLFAGAVGAYELARSERAQQLYASVGGGVRDLQARVRR